MLYIQVQMKDRVHVALVKFVINVGVCANVCVRTGTCGKIM